MTSFICCNLNSPLLWSFLFAEIIHLLLKRVRGYIFNILSFTLLQKPKIVVKVEADPNAKKTVQSTKNADNTEANPNSKKSDVVNSFPFLFFFVCGGVGYFQFKILILCTPFSRQYHSFSLTAWDLGGGILSLTTALWTKYCHNFFLLDNKRIFSEKIIYKITGSELGAVQRSKVLRSTL